MSKTTEYRFLLILFLISGCCGLMYEIVWSRILSLTFGNTYLAMSTVIASFMGGLGFGGLAGGRFARRFRNRLRTYGYLEIAIGICAVFTPLIFYNMDGVTRRLADIFGYESASFLTIRFAVIFGLLLVPTFLMGATLPLLCQHFVSNRETLRSRVGHLYSVNTVGAALGSFLSGFILIEILGNSSVIYLAAAVNITIGAIVLIIPSEPGGSGSESPPPADSPVSMKAEKDRAEHSSTFSRRQALWVTIVFGISGYVSMSLEVVWIRAFRYFISNSTYAFSLIIMVFLVGIGLGSFAGSRLLPRARSPLTLFGLMETLLGCFALLSFPLLSNVFYRQNIYGSLFLKEVTSFPALVFHYSVAIVTVIFLPTLVMGILFPVAATIVTRSVGTVGRSVGTLYFVNTLGTILGSLAGGFVLLPLFGIGGSIILQSLLIFTCGVLLVLVSTRIPSRRKAVYIFLPATLVLLTAAGIDRDFTFTGLYEAPHRDILYYDEGEMATVKVFVSVDGIKTMSVDGNSIGSAPQTQVDMKQRLIAHLPMLIRRGNRQVLSIGLGTGITTGCFTLYPEVESVRTVEIVPGVITGARLFREENRHIFSNSSISIRETDALNYLLLHEDTYDLIASDGKLNPFYSGNTVFLCREFYELCRRRLEPGGLFVQWINANIPTVEYLTVVKTISEVFPHVSLFFLPPAHTFFLAGEDILEIDLRRADRIMRASEAIASDLSMYEIDYALSLAAGYVGESTDFAPLFEELPVNTWDRSVVEFQNPRKWLERPPALNVAGALAAFRLYGVHADDERRLRGLVRDVEHMGEESWQSLRTSFTISGLYREALISLLAERDRPAFDRALERILALDPDDRRARLWMSDPARHITF